MEILIEICNVINYEKIVSFYVGLNDYILLVGYSSRLNLTGFLSEFN